MSKKKKVLIAVIIVVCCLVAVIVGLLVFGKSKTGTSIAIGKPNPSKLEGVWIVETVTTDYYSDKEQTYTMEELENLDATSYIGNYLIFKDDGTCIKYEDGDEETEDYSLNGSNLTIGYDDYVYADSKLTYNDYSGIVSFKKVSNNQSFENPYKYEISENDLAGTWECTAAIIDGSKYSLEELKAMYPEEFSGVYIILKNGGNAIVTSTDEIDNTEWRISQCGAVIGDHNYIYDEEAQTLTVVEGESDYIEYRFILKKKSKSQDATKLPIDITTIQDDSDEDEDYDSDYDLDDSDYDLGDLDF